MKRFFLLLFSLCVLASLRAHTACADEITLPALIQEALKNSPGLLRSEFRWKTSTFRVPQMRSLPDPMFMFGYQNAGFSQFTYRKTNDARFIFSASQSFPFPGKLSLKGEKASKEAQSLGDSYLVARLNTIARVKELYYSLLFLHRNVKLVKHKSTLFSRIEDAALARYSSGMSPQQEVLMAQTEKYMLLEKEEMLNQQIQSLEALLNAAIGRSVDLPLGKPVDPGATEYSCRMDDLLSTAYVNSPEIRSREKIVESANVQVLIAEKDYYPDFALTGSYFKRGGPFQDMWSLATTINVPLYYRTKQREALHEARSLLSEAVHALEETRLIVSSAVRNNCSVVRSSEKLMHLYRDALIPKTYQDFELALSGYATGKTEALTVINRLKSLLDFEISYWEQYAVREQAIARLDSITGLSTAVSQIGPE